MNFTARYCSVILHLMFIFIWSSVGTAGQSSIIVVPTSDTEENGSAYLSLESYAHFDKYENAGFQSYGPSLVYGIRKDVEVGLNYYFTRDESGSSHELQPNMKWRFYNDEQKGVSFATGTVVFIPLNENAGDRTSAMLYLVASKSIASLRDLRITGGAYRQVNGGDEFGTKTGALVGLEQPISDKLTLVADWTTGKNRIGYSNVGFGYAVNRTQYLNVSYSFGNSGRANNYLSVFYGFSF